MGQSSLFGSDDELEDSDDNDHNIEPASEDTDRQLEVATLSNQDDSGITVAEQGLPPVKGLYMIRDLISLELQDVLLRRILDERAVTAQHPQAMLFPRSTESGRDADNCPEYLSDFVGILPDLLRNHLPPKEFQIVFNERQPLQTIINLYEPGQGISPHVDLPHRYAPPIVGVSLASATVMDFVSLDEQRRYAVLLRPGDVYVLLHDARYNYKHGIAYREVDLWRDEEGEVRKLFRGTRVSITFRRMLSITSELSVDA